MYLIIESILLCLIFFLICFLGTGNDEKNIKSFDSYPDKIQDIIMKNEDLKSKITIKSSRVYFILNILIFSIILFFFGFIIRSNSFKVNFINILILGQVLNAFDFLFIDMIWWRNTKRVRFKGTENLDIEYKNPKKHIRAFIKGIFMFIIVALIDGLVLSFL